MKGLAAVSCVLKPPKSGVASKTCHETEALYGVLANQGWIGKSNDACGTMEPNHRRSLFVRHSRRHPVLAAICECKQRRGVMMELSAEGELICVHLALRSTNAHLIDDGVRVPCSIPRRSPCHVSDQGMEILPPHNQMGPAMVLTRRCLMAREI